MFYSNATEDNDWGSRAIFMYESRENNVARNQFQHVTDGFDGKTYNVSPRTEASDLAQPDATLQVRDSTLKALATPKRQPKDK